MTVIPFQPNNPTPEDRYKLLEFVLDLSGRPEDLKNIISLLSPPPDITTILPPGSCKYIRVGILGGGLAGLSAAFELRKLGFDITLFEAEEERIGGRVYTHYFDESKELYGELGAMRFPVSHESTWHYIDLFKLNTRPFIQTNENAFRYVRSIRVRNRPEEVQQYIYPVFNMTPEERATLWPGLQAQVFDRFLLEMSPEVRKEILQVKSLYAAQILEADYYNVRQFMQKQGLSDGAIEMLSSVDPFMGAYLNQSSFEILHELYPASFSFLYEIPGGMVNLPLAFYHSLLNPRPLEYADEIDPDDLGYIRWKPGHVVTGLSQFHQGGPVTVHYKQKGLALNQEETFDFIICALPFSNVRMLELNPIFSSNKMQAIRILNYSPSQKTIMLCKKRFWEEGPPDRRIVGGGSATDMVLNTLWYPSNQGSFICDQELNRKYGCFESPPCIWDLRPGADPNLPGVLIASYNWTQDALRLGNYSEPYRFELVKRQVEAVHGLPVGYLDEIVLDYRTLSWSNHPWALGGFAFYNPQQKRLFSKVATEPEYDNRVFFAGEHVSVSRAWQQGSLQTGMLAANELALACHKYIEKAAQE